LAAVAGARSLLTDPAPVSAGGRRAGTAGSGTLAAHRTAALRMNGLRKVVGAAVLFVVVAVAANAVAVWALPWVVNRIALHRITTRMVAGAENPANVADGPARRHDALIVARGGVN